MIVKAFPDDAPTSPTLLVSIAEGEQEAWERFVRIYTPLVLRWCQRSGVQESDAYDTTQNVMMAVNRSIERFEHRCHDGSFRAWLWGLCRNKIADLRRGSSKGGVALGGTDAIDLFMNIPEHPPETSEDVSGLHLRVLEELRIGFSEQVWTAFWRSTIENDSAKDVAQDLGISVWAVYKARTRVLTRLRQEFGEEISFRSVPD
ncbi:MAG: sigma-70 family RNA polymerase sigma factor [Planctomycetota bacterium]